MILCFSLLEWFPYRIGLLIRILLSSALPNNSVCSWTKFSLSSYTTICFCTCLHRTTYVCYCFCWCFKQHPE